MDELPSWSKTLAMGGGFLAWTVANQIVIVRLLTGEWGGTPHDPLWVGPVSAAVAVFGAVVAVFLAALIVVAREVDTAA